MIRRFHRAKRPGFSLVEILVAVAILAVLAVLLRPAILTGMARAKEARSVGNLSGLGKAAQLFIADNDGSIPSRQPGAQWPGHFFQYMDGNKTLFADPNAEENFLTTDHDPLSGAENFTSYIVNSFDDLVDRRPAIMMLENPAETILLARKKTAGGGFAMNLYIHDYRRAVLPEQFRDGAYYLFVDGSVRFVAVADYGPRLWMADKAEALP